MACSKNMTATVPLAEPAHIHIPLQKQGRQTRGLVDDVVVYTSSFSELRLSIFDRIPQAFSVLQP